MERIDIRQLPKGYEKDIEIMGAETTIVKQRTGYGYKRLFKCPSCGERVQYLYVSDTVKCRHCVGCNVYKDRTDIYPGSDKYICRLMCKIAKKHNIKLTVPFDYTKYLLDKPPKVRLENWSKVLYKLQTLESMRTDLWVRGGGTIDIKTIKYYLNEGLYTFTIHELKTYIIRWTKPAYILETDLNTLLEDMLKK